MRAMRLSLLAALSLICGVACASWSYGVSGNALVVSYSTENGEFPVLRLALNTSYVQMSTGEGCPFGTSFVLWGAYWSQNQEYLGGPVTNTSVSQSGANLRLKVTGTNGGLKYKSQILLTPPIANIFKASVFVSVDGQVFLDNRPNDAFKFFVFSTMYATEKLWDSYSMLTDQGHIWHPEAGHILLSPHHTKMIQLSSGNSSWKINAPTITVTFGKQHPVLGYVIATSLPHADNVNIWAGSPTVVPWYSYDVMATSN